MFVAQELLDVPQHERRYRIEVEHKAAIHRPAGIEFVTPQRTNHNPNRPYSPIGQFAFLDEFLVGFEECLPMFFDDVLFGMQALVDFQLQPVGCQILFDRRSIIYLQHHALAVGHGLIEGGPLLRIIKHLCLDLLPCHIPVRGIDLQLGGVEQLNAPTVPQAKANVRPIYAFSRYPNESRNRCHLAKSVDWWCKLENLHHRCTTH